MKTKIQVDIKCFVKFFKRMPDTLPIGKDPKFVDDGVDVTDLDEDEEVRQLTIVPPQIFFYSFFIGFCSLIETSIETTVHKPQKN